MTIQRDRQLDCLPAGLLPSTPTHIFLPPTTPSRLTTFDLLYHCQYALVKANMSDRVRHGSRQPDPLTSRYQPGHAIFDNSSKLLRRGYFASPQRPQSFVADEPPRTYHSRRRNNSLSDSTLVNEDVGGDLTPALRQGPPSYIDAAPSLPDLQCPDWCRENRRQVAENRRHQLHEPAWMDRAKWERRVEEDDELERHISRITGLDYPPGRGLNRPYRQAEPDRSAAMASCSLCNPKVSIVFHLSPRLLLTSPGVSAQQPRRGRDRHHRQDV